MSRSRRSWRRFLALLAALLVASLVGPQASAWAGVPGSGGAGSSGPAGSTGATTVAWVPAFTSAMAWAPVTAYDTTVRQVVPVGVGGDLVRVELSNAFGTGPLEVGAASVGVQSSGAAALAGSVHELSFGGSPSTTVPTGGSVWSDPLAFPTHAGEHLLVSVFVPGSAAVTSHYDAGPLSYAVADGDGDLVSAASSPAFGLPSTWDRWVAALDVAGTEGPPTATVAFGDSISDGFNIACLRSDICQATTPWPVFLRRRIDLLPAGLQTSVVDESITANTLTVIDTSLEDRYRVGGGGPPGLVRMGSEVLDQPGVKRVILLIGTNDLWFGASAAQVIGGYESFISRAEARGIEVIGSTLLPREGSKGWTAADQANWVLVNHWILTSHAFPVVLDLGAVVADVYDGACQPDRLFPPYNSGDWLHPDSAGQLAMADAIPTSLLGSPGAPTLSPAVPVTPTPGCAHPEVVRVYRPAGPTSTAPSTSTTTTRGAGSTSSSTTPRIPATTAGRRGAGGRPARSPGGRSAAGPVGSSSHGLGTRSLLAIVVVVVAALVVARALVVRRERNARRRRRQLLDDLRRQRAASAAGSSYDGGGQRP